MGTSAKNIAIMLKQNRSGQTMGPGRVEPNRRNLAMPFYMKRVHEKLHVHSKSEAVAKALRNRLVH